ncbi:MAG TPA: molecular chaperone DnaJ [Polyangia bacterium]|nr:molecular chaperone DnaJ [Polyangia bacterium]
MQVEKRDYYEVLGLQRGAEAVEIKKAYRRLAMDCHPDHHPGDHTAEERFKELAEAYQVLSDPQKRELYDQYGHSGPRGAGFGGGFSGIEDILSQFADFFGGGFGGFGGGGRQRGPRVEAGEDLQEQLTITLREAAAGCQKPLELTRLVHCEKCGGSGGKPGSQPAPCGTCGGRGQVAHSQGIFMIATTCPTCRGRGRVVKDKCGECKGGGVERRKESVVVNVPAGIDDGQTLRVPGKGMAGPNGGPPGHLYVTFHVEQDEQFERDGDDLYTEVPLTFAQAALGARVMVPTLEDPIALDVGAGTQPGTIKVLRGRGMPNVHGRGVGDLAVRLTVSVPKKLNAEQRALVEQLGAMLEPAETAARAEAEEEEGKFGFFRRKKKKR